MEYGLIGEKLGHSFSKEIHNKIGGYKYELKEIERDKLKDFIESRDFKGINVTIPYKQDVIPMLDWVDPAAFKIGAVNTVVNRDGKLFGYNTDFLGMKLLIKKTGIDMEGKKVLILGTGGTSLTATAVAESLNAGEILHVSRTGKDGAITYDEAYANHSDADCIINTTPCGMFPNFRNMPIDISRLSKVTGVIDAIYNPVCTELVLDAKDRGIKAAGGLYMLVAQAVCAAEFFFDRKYPDSLLEEIYADMEKKKSNIVLVGMPGSGKSTIGGILAEKLGKELVDTDVLIVKKAGMEITDIFEKFGEKHFRDIESEVVRDVADKTGLIIATGGGAVLRNENVRELKRNGKLYLLDRPVENIVPTDDRPLADTLEKVKQRYNERKPIYEACCDVVIDASVGIEDVVKAMLESKR